MRLSKSERGALHGAWDFISTNIDGADEENHAELSKMITGIFTVLKKSKADRYRELVRK